MVQFLLFPKIKHSQHLHTWLLDMQSKNEVTWTALLVCSNQPTTGLFLAVANNFKYLEAQLS